MTSTAAYTPETLLSLPEFGRFELVGGELVERPVSKGSTRISTRILALLAHFVWSRKLGNVFQNDLGLQIFSDQSKIRFADASFYAHGHEESAEGPGYLHTAPDLVIEVVSPNDIAGEVDVKVAEYLEAGVRLIWVVYPETKAVQIFRPGGQDSRLAAGGTLSGEDVVPGFELPVSDIFDF
ncbi:MAG: Uma2 family endonuclease [Dehalococcoidia bacterium]